MHVPDTTLGPGGYAVVIPAGSEGQPPVTSRIVPAASTHPEAHLLKPATTASQLTCLGTGTARGGRRR